MTKTRWGLNQNLINHHNRNIDHANCFDFQFEQMYESELDTAVESFLASGNTGVVLAIAQACKRLGAKQSHFFVVR